MANRTKNFIVTTVVCIFIVAAAIYFGVRSDSGSRDPVGRVNAIAESSSSLYNKIQRLDKLFRSTDIEILAQQIDLMIASDDPCIDVAWAYMAGKVHQSKARDYSSWKHEVLDSCSDNNVRAFVTTMID